MQKIAGKLPKRSAGAVLHIWHLQGFLYWVQADDKTPQISEKKPGPPRTVMEYLADKIAQ